MTPALPRRAYVALDRLTKVVAVGLLAGALGGVDGSTADSMALGVAGLAVGLLTVFVEPVGETPDDAGRTPDDGSGETLTDDSGDRPPTPASSPDAEGFFDRFAHPLVALVATVGVVLWLGDFLLAAAGLGLRGYDAALAVDLFRLSGVVGAVGLLFVVVPAAYVGALYVRRFVRTRRAGGE
ncbi:MAG: hypothetical protein ABEJ78_06165 [Haloferacaceae archaeon]